MKHIFKTLIVTLCLSQVTLANSPNWNLNETNKGWKNEFLALKYFHNSELQRQWAWHLLGNYPFKESEHILDFGCGDGKITAEISNFIPHGSILGVDLSECMITFAKRCFPTLHYPNMRFEQSRTIDFSDENISDRKYDLIYSFCVFHLVPNPIQILNNLQTHLKDDGRLLLIIPSGNNPAFFQAANEIFEKYQLLPPWSSKDNSKSTITMRTKEGCIECLTIAGLEPISITPIHTTTAFYNKQELIDWMIGTVTANWQLPLDKADDFFRDLVDRMAELDSDVIDKSGAYNMKLTRLEVIAKLKDA